MLRFIIIIRVTFNMILTTIGILSPVSIIGMVTIRDLDIMVITAIHHTFIIIRLIMRDMVIRDGTTTAITTITDITAHAITMAIVRRGLLGEEISHAVLKMSMPAVNRFKDPAPKRQPVITEQNLGQHPVMREWQWQEKQEPLKINGTFGLSDIPRIWRAGCGWDMMISDQCKKIL